MLTVKFYIYYRIYDVFSFWFSGKPPNSCFCGMLASKLMELEVCWKADLFLILGANLPLQMLNPSPERPRRSWKSGKSSRHRVFASTSLCVCYFVRLSQSPFLYLGASGTVGQLCWCSKEPRKWSQRSCRKRKVCLFADFQDFNVFFSPRSSPGLVELVEQKQDKPFSKKENIPINFCLFFLFVSILVFVPSTVLQRHWTFPPCVC